MAKNYGVRYLKVDQFIKYCENLNIKTDNNELEYYQKNGFMLPTVLLVYPEDYIRLQTLWQYGKASEPPKLSQWPELEKIFDKLRVLPKDYADLTDEELIDSFDREIENSPHIIRPTVENYKPWKDYEIFIEYDGEKKVNKEIAEHYYSYWQVYQLKNIQKYPDLWINKTLLDRIPSETKQGIFRPWAPDTEKLQGFNGMAKMFDALSFWITMCNLEKRRTFSLIPEKHQVKTLNASQHQDYLNRVVNNAKLVQMRFAITTDDLYNFMYELTELRNKYVEDEKHKLADELRNDIIYQANLIEAITNAKWDEIANELGKRYTIWTKKNFRHLDILVKERDNAYDLLKVYAENYSKVLTDLKILNQTWKFQNNEIDEFLDYCMDRELSVFMTAFSGMVATQEEYTNKSRRVYIYTNIKNILTAFEYLLKNFATTGNLKIGKRAGLSSIIEVVMKNETNWILLFKNKKKLAGADNSTEFFANLTSIMNDSELLISENTYWARAFLVAALARNFTVHDYPNDDWFYGELFGEMLISAVHAILYSWQVAKKENWI